MNQTLSPSAYSIWLHGLKAQFVATVCTLLGVRSTLRSLAGQGPGAELARLHLRQLSREERP